MFWLDSASPKYDHGSNKLVLDMYCTEEILGTVHFEPRSRYAWTGCTMHAVDVS